MQLEQADTEFDLSAEKRMRWFWLLDEGQIFAKKIDWLIDWMNEWEMFVAWSTDNK